MRETDLRGKACAASVAMVAGLGMVGMGLVSDRVMATDITSVTDTINVIVPLSCTFNSTTNKTYIGSAENGEEVNNFNESGVHEFNLFCNDSNGFTVTATPHDLEATGIERKISYTDNYTHSGTSGMWTAVITSESAGVTVASPVPVGGGKIISSDSGTSAAGVDFTATYSAYVGTETPAGTYTGTIIYTLTAEGGSNNGDNSGTGGENGNNSDNEQTDNNGNGGGADNNSGIGGESGTGGETPNNSSESSNTPNNAPLAVNNTYNTYSTYNTYNTYNTTTYSGSGTSTTGTTGIPVVTGGNTGNVTDDTANEGDGDEGSSGTNDSYEQPLGVTTNTSSVSSKKSEVDWTPLVVAGAIAVVGGAAAVALARSNKEEE